MNSWIKFCAESNNCIGFAKLSHFFELSCKIFYVGFAQCGIVGLCTKLHIEELPFAGKSVPCRGGVNIDKIDPIN